MPLLDVALRQPTTLVVGSFLQRWNVIGFRQCRTDFCAKRFCNTLLAPICCMPSYACGGLACAERLRNLVSFVNFGGQEAKPTGRPVDDEECHRRVLLLHLRLSSGRLLSVAKSKSSGASGTSDYRWMN